MIVSHASSDTTKSDMILTPNPAIAVYTPSTVAAPSTDAIPTAAPYARVRCAQIIPIGPTGAHMISPIRRPLKNITVVIEMLYYVSLITCA